MKLVNKVKEKIKEIKDNKRFLPIMLYLDCIAPSIEYPYRYGVKLQEQQVIGKELKYGYIIIVSKTELTLFTAEKYSHKEINKQHITIESLKSLLKYKGDLPIINVPIFAVVETNITVEKDKIFREYKTNNITFIPSELDKICKQLLEQNEPLKKEMELLNKPTRISENNPDEFFQFFQGEIISIPECHRQLTRKIQIITELQKQAQEILDKK